MALKHREQEKHNVRNVRTEQEIIQNWKGDPSKPLVSICCITYNHEPYVEDALEGFLIQETDFPFEILIHDDASTDKTADIIRQYEAKYPNLIKPIYQAENQYSKGKKPNPEFNFPRAKGKYVALCEGDDYWINTKKLRYQVNFLENNGNTNICFTFSCTLKSNGKFSKPNSLFPITYSQFDFLTGNKYQTSTCTILFRRFDFSIYNQIFRSAYAGDNWIKILSTMSGYGYVLPILTSVYRIHEGGIWSSLQGKNLDLIKLRDLIIKLKYATAYCKSAKWIILCEIASILLRLSLSLGRPKTVKSLPRFLALVLQLRGPKIL